MRDIRDYLDIRSERYKATNEDSDYVFISKGSTSPSPLANRSVESLVKKYTKAYKNNKSMSPIN